MGAWGRRCRSRPQDLPGRLYGWFIRLRGDGVEFVIEASEKDAFDNLDAFSGAFETDAVDLSAWNDGQRVELLLENMKDVPGWKRTARFIAVLALVGQDVSNGYSTSEGVLEGAITHQPIGHNGFGYDPVFWLAPYSKTAAELSGEGKDKLSHRGRAFEGLRRTLRSLE